MPAETDAGLSDLANSEAIRDVTHLLRQDGVEVEYFYAGDQMVTGRELYTVILSVPKKPITERRP